MLTSYGAENIGLFSFSWLLFKKHLFKLLLEFPLISMVSNEALKLRKLRSIKTNISKVRKESGANGLSQPDFSVEIWLKQSCV